MRKFYGVAGLVLFAAAVAVGFVSMAAESTILGLLYLAASLFASLVMICLFCTKCSEKGNCGHVLPGIVAKMMPPRSGKYTAAELLCVFFAIAVVVLMPQTWLLKDSSLFVVFWLLVALACAATSLLVCRSCGNEACPLKKR
jgi:hypothetical protein